MFVDETVLTVAAGSGGDGSSAFRREKYVPMGGPAGGNGGSGSDIIFKVDTGLKTLLDLKSKKLIKGYRGDHGGGKNQYGACAEDLIIKVPPGTIVTDEDKGEIIADLTRPDQEAVIAKGGRGGRGNKSFATHANTAPNLSENGEPGEEKRIKVELKLLADIGLVGMPSVGKSTIISMISSVKPKIAAYHFTTLTPNLGVVKVDDESFVVADLPGLIKGASQGDGLGDKFLKHIERTKVIVHVIDMSAFDGRDPYEDYLTINDELKEFNPKLLKKPQMIIANKMDIKTSKDNLKAFKKKIKDIPIFEASAIENKGLKPIIYKMKELLNNFVEEAEPIISKHVDYIFKAEEKLIITKMDQHIWEVSGKRVEKLYKMIRFNGDEALQYFFKKLRGMGLDEQLEKLNVQEGDTVKIFDNEFEYKK